MSDTKNKEKETRSASTLMPLLGCACGGGAYYDQKTFNTTEYAFFVYCAKCLKRTGEFGNKYQAKEQWDKIASAT